MNSPNNLTVKVYHPESEIGHPSQLIAHMWRDLRDSRELAIRLFIRDLKAQYRESLLGYFWAFIPPVLNAGVFIFLSLSGAITISETGVPYPLFVLVGTLLWQTFVDAMSNPAQSLRAARGMMSKVSFPHEAIIIGGLGIVLFNIAVRFLIIVIVMAIYRIHPTAKLVWFPFAFFGIFIGGLGIGLCFGIAGSLYTDIIRGVPLLGQVMMYLTPVVYPPSEGGILGVISMWNPISPFLTSAREALLGSAFTNLYLTFYYLPLFVVITLVGWLVFKVVMPRIVERMGM